VLVPLTKELVTLKRMRLRGMYDTRMAALGGAKRRPARPTGVAWNISLGSSRPCIQSLASDNGPPFLEPILLQSIVSAIIARQRKHASKIFVTGFSELTAASVFIVKTR
jgi:hypothetical protein